MTAGERINTKIKERTMSHTQTTATKKRLPKGYFAALRPQMEEDAKTMSKIEGVSHSSKMTY